MQHFSENSVEMVSADKIGPWLSGGRLFNELELQADGGVFSGPKISAASGVLRKGGTFLLRSEKFEPGDLSDDRLLASVEGEHAMRFFVDSGTPAPAQTHGK